MAYERDPDELGSLWRREGAKGEYLTGEIAGQQVICFPVKSSNPKAPAWRVLKSKPRGDRPNSSSANPRHDDEAPF